MDVIVVGVNIDYVFCTRFLVRGRCIISFKALEEVSLTVMRINIRLAYILRCLMIGVV